MSYDRVKTFFKRLLYLLVFVGGVSLIWASLNTGCNPAEAGNPSNLTPCDTNDECEAGELCSALKVCLERASGDLNIGIELRPDGNYIVQNSGLKLAQVEVPPWDVAFDPTHSRIVVEYEEGVKIGGVVTIAGAVGGDLSANVLASRPSRIPGRPSVLTSTGVQVVPDNTELAAYELFLAKHPGYTLKAIPSAPFDREFHPRTMRNVEVNADSTMDFVFGDPDSTSYVEGTVTLASQEPVRGATVTAVDETGAFASSVGITDPDGYFSLSIPRGLRAYTLTVGPGEENPYLPTVTFTDQLYGDSTIQGPEYVGVYALPVFLTPIEYQFALVGRAGTGIVDPVPGATVTFESALEGMFEGTGVYRMTATSDANGIVSVNLVPGDSGNNRDYTMTIVTSPESEFVSLQTDLPVGPNGGAGPQFELDRRISVQGEIHSGATTAMGSIAVSARPSTESVFGGSSTDTDAEGRFVLMLDPGTYSLDFLPPSGSPLPFWTADNVDIDPDGPTVQDLGTFGLPPAAVLEVSVVSPGRLDNVPLEGIRVAIYLVADECADAGPDPADPCTEPASLLGIGVTDAAGLAQILIPEP